MTSFDYGFFYRMDIYFIQGRRCEYISYIRNINIFIYIPISRVGKEEFLSEVSEFFENSDMKKEKYLISDSDSFQRVYEFSEIKKNRLVCYAFRKCFIESLNDLQKSKRLIIVPVFLKDSFFYFKVFQVIMSSLSCNIDLTNTSTTVEIFPIFPCSYFPIVFCKKNNSSLSISNFL